MLEDVPSPHSPVPGLEVPSGYLCCLWSHTQGARTALQAEGLTKTSLALRWPQAKGLSPYQEESPTPQILFQVVPEVYEPDLV